LRCVEVLHSACVFPLWLCDPKPRQIQKYINWSNLELGRFPITVTI
jgi:hypothetical protein